MTVRFEKKLVILQGLHDSSRATITIEANHSGNTCHISGLLDDLEKGQYMCAVKTNVDAQVFVLGMNGRINAKFELDDNIGKSDTIHCILFLRNGTIDRPYLYGTNGSNKLWEGNMMDGIKKSTMRTQQTIQQDNNISNINKENYEKVTTASYSENESTKYDKKEFDKVLELLDSTEYDDNAIATVNFYDFYKDKNSVEKDNKDYEMQEINLSNNQIYKDEEKQQINEIDTDVNCEENNTRLDTKSEVASTNDFVQQFKQNIVQYHSTNPSQQTILDQSTNPENQHTLNPQSNIPLQKTIQEQLLTRQTMQTVPIQPIIPAVQQDNITKYHKHTVINQQDLGKKFSNSPKLNNIIQPNIPNPIREINLSNSQYLNPKISLDNTAMPNFQSIPNYANNLNETKTIINQLPFQNYNVNVNSMYNNPNAFQTQNIFSPNQIVDIPKIQSNTSIVTQSAKNTRPLSFFDKISEQINALFETYTKEIKLEQMLPDTKWVRIDYDNNGKYYCIGLIGSRPDYICYAVPTIYTETPPKELDGYCQWLPLDSLSPKQNGYWLLYQDAITGESVTL